MPSTGTRATGQLPYPCAAPLTKIRLQAGSSNSAGRYALSPAEADSIEEVLDRAFVAVKDLLQRSPPMLQQLPSAVEKSSSSGGSGKSPYSWYDLSFKDAHEKANYNTLFSGGGHTLPLVDPKAFANENRMTLESMQHVNGYHMTRCTMKVFGVSPEVFVSEVHCPDKAKKHRLAPGMKDYACWLTNPRFDPCSPLEEDPQRPPQGNATQPLDAFFSEVNEERENASLRVLAAAKAKVLANSTEGGTASLSCLRNWRLESNVFNAPPPVSCREALMVVEKLYSPEDDSFYVYGCSVDCAPHPSTLIRRRDADGGGKRGASIMSPLDFDKCVRSLYLFGWKLERSSSLKNSTKATMVSVMNPGGWTPSFLLSWFKSEVGREISSLRKGLYMLMKEKASLKKTMQDCPVEALAGAVDSNGDQRHLPSQKAAAPSFEGCTTDEEEEEGHSNSSGSGSVPSRASHTGEGGRCSGPPRQPFQLSGGPNEDAPGVLQTEDVRLATGLEEEELVCF